MTQLDVIVLKRNIIYLQKENKDLLKNWLEEREQHHELQIRYEILYLKYKELMNV